MQPDALFQTISTAFADLGVPKPQAISRTPLLREGSFVGHRYLYGQLQAICLPDSVVEFFGGDGELLRSLGVEPRQGLKKAA